MEKDMKDVPLRHPFSGADWLQSQLDYEMVPFGRKVADILGFVWRGMYHMDDSAIRKVKWNDAGYIRITVTNDMATWDFNKLTELVILCHDQCVRLSIDGAGPRRLALLFHARERDGGMSRRHPTMEQAISALRSEAYHPVADQEKV